MVALEDWDVQDDILLREAVEQGASLAALAAGAVPFSRNFSEEEVTARWRTLLFDKRISKQAAIRMGNAERVPRPPPRIGDDLPTIMAAYRSARAAAGVPGSVAPPAGEPPTFSEAEDALLAQGPLCLLLDPSWHPSNRDARVEAATQRRRDNAQLRHLERASRAATDRAAKGALATVRGMKLRYLMRKTEVLVGRSTDEQKVDIDLGIEGNASKVSRQHAFIQLRKDGKFYLRNVGRRVVLVNNLPIESGQRAQLPPDCLVEIGGLYFIFMPNNRRKERLPSATAAEQAPGDAAMDDEPAAEPAAEAAAEPAAETAAEAAAEAAAEPAVPSAEPAEHAAADAEEPPAAAMTAE